VEGREEEDLRKNLLRHKGRSRPGSPWFSGELALLATISERERGELLQNRPTVGEKESPTLTGTHPVSIRRSAPRKPGAYLGGDEKLGILARASHLKKEKKAPHTSEAAVRSLSRYHSLWRGQKRGKKKRSIFGVSILEKRKRPQGAGKIKRNTCSIKKKKKNGGMRKDCVIKKEKEGGEALKN